MENQDLNNDNINNKDVNEENNKELQTKLVEIFLGKNVIAKIALFLIFLGIISFGQLAYVDWLNDLGRVIFIAGLGVVFGCIGYYFESKKMVVFNNVFYSASIFTLFLSIVLAKHQFYLIGNSAFMYLSLGLLIVVAVYFFKKRYDFLDSVIIVFTTTVLTTALQYKEIMLTTSNYFEISILILITSLIYYFYIAYFTKSNKRLQIFQLSFIIFSISVMVTTIHINYYSINHFLKIMYTMLLLYVVYLSNIKNMRTSHPFSRYIIFGFTIIAFTITGLYIFDYIRYVHEYKNLSYIPVYIFILIVPLYIFFRINKTQRTRMVRYLYLITGISMITIFLFITSNIRNNYLELHEVNVIHIVIALLSYVIYKITKERSMQLMAIWFIALLVMRNINYNIYELSNAISYMNMLVPGIIFSVLLLGINLYFKYKENQTDHLEEIIVHIINIIFVLPIIVTITKDYVSSDDVILLVAATSTLILYRWLLELPIFKNTKNTNFINVLNIKLIILIFIINLYYFDHNFALASDVQKFIVVFALNIYVVKPILSLYHAYAGDYDDEVTAIIFYAILVLIHSFFIHRYINIEFDKVILSSYFMIASAVGILIGFRFDWKFTRKIGLFAIYYSLGKFFIYDFYTQDFSTFVRMITYFILGFTLLGIALLYSYLEKKYVLEVAE